MTDLIIVAVLAVIIASAAGYVYKAKKSGAKCIGCAVDGGCAHSHTEGCGCGGTDDARGCHGDAP